MKPIRDTDILILGAGIAGYETFRTLEKKLKHAGQNKRITIVDSNSYFTFVPMLHEAASGSIEPAHCAIPLRELTHKTPHLFFKATVTHIDIKKKLVTTDRGILAFHDACVIALGSKTNYYGVPGAEKYTHHVRSLKGAMALRHEVLTHLSDPEKHTLTISVVGGGYTGVEVAGQYADLMNKDLKVLYPEKHVEINLIQNDAVILPRMSARIQEKVSARLKALGIAVYTKTSVTKVMDESIELDTKKTLPSDITIWTAGFKNVAPDVLDTGYTERGQIAVSGTLSLPAYPNIYAIGDIAHIADPKTQIAYPQLAEAAHKEGEYVGHAIVTRLKGNEPKPFYFSSKGQLMPVGDWWGMAQIGPITLFGRLAWWIRRTVYVLFMPGFLRKIRIIFDWSMHSFGFRDFIHIEEPASDVSDLA